MLLIAILYNKIHSLVRGLLFSLQVPILFSIKLSWRRLDCLFPSYRGEHWVNVSWVYSLLSSAMNFLVAHWQMYFWDLWSWFCKTILLIHNHFPIGLLDNKHMSATQVKFIDISSTCSRKNDQTCKCSQEKIYINTWCCLIDSNWRPSVAKQVNSWDRDVLVEKRKWFCELVGNALVLGYFLP